MMPSMQILKSTTFFNGYIVTILMNYCIKIQNIVSIQLKTTLRSQEGLQTVARESKCITNYETMLLKEGRGKGADLSNFGNEQHL